MGLYSVKFDKSFERILIIILMLALTLYIKPIFMMAQDYFSLENKIALEYGAALCGRDKEKLEQLTYGTEYDFESLLEDLSIPDECEPAIAWHKERLKTEEGVIVTLYLQEKAGDGWLTPTIITVELIALPDSALKVKSP